MVPCIHEACPTSLVEDAASLVKEDLGLDEVCEVVAVYDDNSINEQDDNVVKLSLPVDPSIIAESRQILLFDIDPGVDLDFSKRTL